MHFVLFGLNFQLALLKIIEWTFREILKSLPQDDLSSNCQSVNLDLDKILLGRALGILRNPDNDTIKVKALVVIATRLKNTIVNKIPFEKENMFLWTDLKIVLYHLNSNHASFGVYIAHRINEIRQSADPDN